MVLIDKIMTKIFFGTTAALDIFWIAKKMIAACRCCRALCSFTIDTLSTFHKITAKKSIGICLLFQFQRTCCHFCRRGSCYVLKNTDLIVKTERDRVCVRVYNCVWLTYARDWVKVAFKFPTTYCMKTGLEHHLKCFPRIIGWGQYFMWSKYNSHSRESKFISSPWVTSHAYLWQCLSGFFPKCFYSPLRMNKKQTYF